METECHLLAADCGSDLEVDGCVLLRGTCTRNAVYNEPSFVICVLRTAHENSLR